MNTKLTKIISGLFVATAAFQTASAGNITDIKVSSLPNKQKIVKVSFDKEIVNPTGFVTSSPARIALDFEQTGISMDQQVLEYADPLLSKISAAQNSSRARLVLNLNKPGQYNTEVRGNKVWIFINESDDTVSAPARPAVKAAPAAPAKQQAAAPFTESVVSVHRSARQNNRQRHRQNNRRRHRQNKPISISAKTAKMPALSNWRHWALPGSPTSANSTTTSSLR